VRRCTAKKARDYTTKQPAAGRATAVAVAFDDILHCMSTESASTPGNAAQTAAQSYRLAARDEDFILGDSMRGVRFLLEYAKPEEALRNWRIRSTFATT
jgi:hypothetical protein